MTSINLNVRRFAAYSLAALVLLNGVPSRVSAQDTHSHTTAAEDEASLAQQAAANTLLKAVRDATDRYQDVKVAIAQGYALQFGCVAGEDSGAMGLHYVNGDLVNSGVLDPARPQIIIYEPMPDGTLKLIGADFLVFADAWNATHSAPPQLMGQAFHLFTAPNRFGLPAFYTLHVWAWKKNPTGAFVNWHQNVSCNSFTGK
jgi:hypothetical protein